MLKMKTSLFLCLALLASACFKSAGEIESRFFKGDIATRAERLEKFPLDQQYLIFLYGNQVIHPPTTGLAAPIAKQGKLAADFVLQELRRSSNDLDFRDSLRIFSDMRGGGYYDVCSNPVAISEIRRNEEKIRDDDWRNIYRQMLSHLCPNP